MEPKFEFLKDFNEEMNKCNSMVMIVLAPVVKNLRKGYGLRIIILMLLSMSWFCSQAETINGFNVIWKGGTTQKQKSVISELLNNMIKVEGGSFQMGSEENYAFENEGPVHLEKVASFWIGKYEVTQKLWEAVMGNNPSYFKGENQPVTYVSWNDCNEFIQKLNDITGLRFRLPTEIEWEFAAHGGNKSQGFRISGGTPEFVAWYKDNSGGRTHDVGTTMLGNELNIYDMAGNVKEWTSTEYTSYTTSKFSGNTYKDGPYYYFRGGSFKDHPRWLRITLRNYENPDSQSDDLGLRLAM